MSSQEEIAILIMAAGGSTRLGQPKQLLKKNNTTLLNKTIASCLASGLGPVYTVLGAHSVLVKSSIIERNCEVLINKNWQEGLSNSIAFGVSQILKKEYKGALIVLVDQVFLTHSILKIIGAKVRSGAKLVSCQYEQGSGAPTYFDASYFNELTSLEGDIGAKAIIEKNKDELILVPFIKGCLDIDTPKDISLLHNDQ